MARERKGSADKVTIVGGRPMHRAVDVTQLPIGLEQALTLAALDWRFRDRLREDPLAAAAEKGIRLDDAEVALLRSTSSEQLVDLSRRMVIPPEMSRRKFVKAVAASITAMVGGAGFLLCSGCTGADSWDPGLGREEWATLAGHTCYLYLPASVVGNPSQPHLLLVALHGQGETCLANVQRWRAAADNNHFSLVSVNWTEEPATPEARTALIRDLWGIVQDFAALHPVTTDGVYLCGRAEATPIVWEAGFKQADAAWTNVLFLGGIPDGNWATEADLLLADVVAAPPCLVHVVGDADAEFDGAEQFRAAATAHGMTVRRIIVTGQTATATLDFSALWNDLAFCPA